MHRKATFDAQKALDSGNQGAKPCPQAKSFTRRRAPRPGIALNKHLISKRISVMTQVEPNRMANAIRGLSMDAVEKAKSGHPGLPMGAADIASIAGPGSIVRWRRGRKSGCSTG